MSSRIGVTSNNGGVVHVYLDDGSTAFEGNAKVEKSVYRK